MKAPESKPVDELLSSEENTLKGLDGLVLHLDYFDVLHHEDIWWNPVVKPI